MTTNRTAKPDPAELRERAVREYGGEWASLAAATRSVSAKVGCSAETLRPGIGQAERDTGRQGGPNADDRERIKTLERENRELRQANEILRSANADFAQAKLDRRSKP